MFLCRHTHELIDQIFSRIAVALAKMLAMTFSDLAKIITFSYDPKHKVMKLTRTINIQAWLQGTTEKPVLQRHWSDITEAQQFLIEACPRLDDGTEVTTRVTIKASESSSSPWGPRMVPLCHLPSERPVYNASRPIFSRWERDSQNKQTGNRTSDEKAYKDFEDSKKMICALDGPIAEMRCDKHPFNSNFG